MTLEYVSSDATPVDIDPIDVDAVVIVGFDWSEWLAEQGISDIDESTWHAGTGIALGDGVAVVSRKGKSVLPPAPSISAGVTKVGVYVDGGLDGDRVIVSNHVRAGSVAEERSIAIRIREM